MALQWLPFQAPEVNGSALGLVEPVTEWTGLKLGEALRKAENREEWRKVVAQSSLVPQRSTRLRDKRSVK